MTQRLLISLLAIGVAGACGPAARVDVDAERDAILAADRAWAESGGDATAFASAFVSDGVFIPSGGASVWGVEPIRAAVEAMAASVEWSASKADVSASGDLGYSMGDYELTSAAGDVTVGEYVTIWRKQEDGQWKVVVDIGSESEPPQPAPLQADPVGVDPDHYTVEFENDQVRVLRITYGPGEKSTMHEHRDGVVVFLTDAKTKFTLADGEREEAGQAGQVNWAEGEQHLPENIGDAPMEVILIELKS